MNQPFDVIVLGLGANGSSALYHLSKTGCRVCGIDRFSPPHTFGSSHGESRIIRQAYHEHPMYVPLVQAAYQLWFELEESYRKPLFLKTGGLLLGNENSLVVQGAKQSAEMHRIAYDDMTAEDITQRFPAFMAGKDTVGVFEKEAGILFPERCIEANLNLSVNNGALVLRDEKVVRIDYSDDIISIHTDRDVYETYKLIVSAGAWLGQLLPELHLPLVAERQVQYWFQNKDADKQRFLMPDTMPVFIWEFEHGKLWYGIPDLGNGVKVAFHHGDNIVEPDLLTHAVDAKEIEQISDMASKYMNAPMQFHHSSVCMYTSTPDEHFIIDHHPLHKNIIVASPCSGHGFKFSSLSGKLLADMALEKDVSFDLTPFRISRFLSAL